MKSYFSLFIIAALFSIFFFSCQSPNDPATADTLEKPNGCTTIQSGELLDSGGNPIETGYDEWGYNYQAHIFNGYYDNNSRPEIPVEDGNWLQMKWNDAWLANKDCDDDNELDRPNPYTGSGAWLTNHENGTYINGDGNTCHYTYFVKIIAVPDDATNDGVTWFNADDTEIGPMIWGSFAIIQEVWNDPCAGTHGVQYVSPDHPGLGNW